MRDEKNSLIRLGGLEVAEVHSELLEKDECQNSMRGQTNPSREETLKVNPYNIILDAYQTKN